MCTPNPAWTYTEEYKQECLARWFVNTTAEKRTEYLTALNKRKNGRQRLDDLKNIALRLGLSVSDFHF